MRGEWAHWAARVAVAFAAATASATSFAQVLGSGFTGFDPKECGLTGEFENLIVEIDQGRLPWLPDGAYIEMLEIHAGGETNRIEAHLVGAKWKGLTVERIIRYRPNGSGVSGFGLLFAASPQQIQKALKVPAGRDFEYGRMRIQPYLDGHALLCRFSI